MPTVDIVVETQIAKSFRVDQIKGMFDLPIKDKTSHSWKFDFPYDLDPTWRIGLIVGPSGSGKSTVARSVFGEYIQEGFEWSRDKAILDDFKTSDGVRDIVQALTSVGLSSPPSWCKPFAVLSNGEKFRVELAKAIVEGADKGCVVIDEFTSVVDRTVAKVASAAIAKAVRRREMKFVAVSCHYDIMDWLEPDWVLDMKTNAFVRRRLRRPKIDLEIASVDRSAWRIFAHHHYLSGRLHPGSKCYGGFWGDELVVFVAVLPSPGHKGVRRVHRIVVLPDYQGIGIGHAMLGAVGSIYRAKGNRLFIVSSHPGIIKGLASDHNWICRSYHKTGSRRHRGEKFRRVMLGRPGVPLAGYEYVGS